MAIIGIDLGTTNSLAAVWRNGSCELIPNAAGSFLTPSVVSVDEDGSILVGRAARDRLISHPDHTAARFKRHMGTDKVFHLGGRAFTPEDLSALVLRSLKEDAEAYLGEEVTEAVISVPAYFAEPQRSATKRAGHLAGLKVERLVNEPTAAAMSAHIAEGDQDKVCLVFDFGGGTLDISLVERFESVVSVTAVSGDNSLGGSDFDGMIAKAFCAETGIPFDELPRQKQELLVRQAETCKMALTTQDPVIMAVDDGELSASLALTNDWLIRACAPLFQRIRAPIQQVLTDAGIPLDELDELVMVGGSSHMPSVQGYLSRLLHREPAVDTRPDTAIALGAGICAAMKARVPELKQFVLTDVCPFTLGVGVADPTDPKGLLMSPVIERNCVLPSSKEEIYYPVHKNQREVCIRIYQGENLHCADNILLGSITMEVRKPKIGDLLSRREDDDPGKPVRVRFTYDINGLLEVEVVNGAGKRASLVIKNRNMSPQEVEARLKELSALKLHPREQERPRALIARAERLYTATTRDTRQQLGQLLGWYQGVLNQQDPLLVARACSRMEKILEQIESALEIGGLPGEPFFNEDGELEDDTL